MRYADVLYHAQQRVAVDVIVYHDPTYAEPWYLVVPCWTRRAWRPAQVVELYRRRMQIEQSFRDFKTHLGCAGCSSGRACRSVARPRVGAVLQVID